MAPNGHRFARLKPGNSKDSLKTEVEARFSEQPLTHATHTTGFICNYVRTKGYSLIIMVTFSGMS